MNIELRRAMTVEDYLAWAQDQEDGPRTELINGQIVAMSPERVIHNRVKNSFYLALRSAVMQAAVECEVFSDSLTVPIDKHTAYEPDASVRCGSPLPDSQMTVTDPVIVAEVISPTSRHHDTSAKLIGYFKLLSVAHYLVVDPDLCTVTHYTRNTAPATLRDGTLRLDPPGIELSVPDLLR